MTDSTAPAVCENCATPLQGEYCHRCGQRAHNPLQSFGHALEEVAESFWHLDGRVFRTLKDLLVPGRIANAYLAGHRAPYLPPLRVFVILAALAFFVAQFTLGSDAFNIDNEFDRDTTVQQVEQHRDARLKEQEESRRQLQQTPNADVSIVAIDTGERLVRDAAQARISRLQGVAAATSTAPSAATNAAAAAADNDVHIVIVPPTKAHPGYWTWLPDFSHRWLLAKQETMTRNVGEAQKDPRAAASMVHEFVHAMPSALFVLVPVFALLLKLIYLRSKRGYLEHLVVALYSQSFLMLALLAVFLLQIGAAHLPHVAASALGWLQTLLWLWMAAYLWISQRRIYAQSALKTSVKYVLLGGLYFWMVAIAASVLAMASLSHD